MTLKNIAILGGSGAIGSAFTHLLSGAYPEAHITSFSRKHHNKHHGNISNFTIDWENETTIEQAAQTAAQDAPLDLVIVTNGILCDQHIMPEKSLKDLSAEKFQKIFAVNTIIPALIAKHFVPKLNKKSPAIFAALSARVGSISDNHIGGWYAYRASKAALNMVIKNTAIETARKNNHAIIVGLHPGTVDSDLSKPFQGNVPEHKLFTAEYSARKLLDVLNSVTPQQSGQCFAWDGQEILP